MDFLNFRAKHNLTQSELAEILGVSTTMINLYECGKAAPSAKNKIRFKDIMENWKEENKK